MKKLILCAAVFASVGAGTAEKADRSCQLKYIVDRGCPYIQYEEQKCKDRFVFMGYCFKEMCQEGMEPKAVWEESKESCTVKTES